MDFGSTPLPHSCLTDFSRPQAWLLEIPEAGLQEICKPVGLSFPLCSQLSRRFLTAPSPSQRRQSRPVRNDTDCYCRSLDSLETVSTIYRKSITFKDLASLPNLQDVSRISHRCLTSFSSHPHRLLSRTLPNSQTSHKMVTEIEIHISSTPVILRPGGQNSSCQDTKSATSDHTNIEILRAASEGLDFADLRKHSLVLGVYMKASPRHGLFWPS